MRRVVCGTRDGIGTIILDEPSGHRTERRGGVVIEDLWAGMDLPSMLSTTDHTARVTPGLDLPPGAVRVRVVTFPAGGEDVPQPFAMHRTPTADYAYVLEGSIDVVMEDKRTSLHPGDCIVQLGALHTWRNVSGAPCRLLFVCVGAAA